MERIEIERASILIKKKKYFPNISDEAFIATEASTPRTKLYKFYKIADGYVGEVIKYTYLAYPQGV